MKARRLPYEKLKTSERLALLVEASARRDFVERSRLWQTAPRATYTSIDHDVVHGWNSLESFTSTMMISLQSALLAFAAAHALHLSRMNYDTAWNDAGGSIAALNKRQRDRLPSDEDVESVLTARVRDVLTSVAVFDDVCGKIGFTRDVLVSAFVSSDHAEQLQRDIAIVQRYAHDITIDERIKSEAIALLSERYPALVRRQEQRPHLHVLHK